MASTIVQDAAEAEAKAAHEAFLTSLGQTINHTPEIWRDTAAQLRRKATTHASRSNGHKEASHLQDEGAL